MPPKLTGHLLQLTGFSLVFLGLGAVVAVVFLAGSFPAVPFWAFVLAAFALGAPLMVAGGRVSSAGRGRVLGMTPVEAAQEYHRGTVVLAAYLAVLLLQGAWVAAPLVLFGPGPFVLAWITVWMLVLCACRRWVTWPVVRAFRSKPSPAHHTHRSC
jgi:hypothetical protein